MYASHSRSSTSGKVCIASRLSANFVTLTRHSRVLHYLAHLLVNRVALAEPLSWPLTFEQSIKWQS
jgi:hypothetical protein